MKTYIKNLSILPVLTAGLGLMLAGRVTAQTLTTLHNFAVTTADTNGVPFNADGVYANGRLILSGNTLYGEAISGGSGGVGTIYAVNTDGTGFTNLHIFTAAPESPYTNSDGANPNGGLIMSGNTLYGTTKGGGSSSWGTVFKLNTDGTGFTNLYTFAGYPDDGAYPYRLTLSGNTLYGTARGGGSWNLGTVFKLSTDGTGFTNLYSFAGYPDDGASPWDGLILANNTLYGTTAWGGGWSRGTVFAINTDGTSYKTLYNFTGDNNGADPYDGLTLSSNILYGTTINGGITNNGTVFRLQTDGTGFATLHLFTGGSDGVKSGEGLILSGNILYGTAQPAGSSGGTVFAVHTDGSGFTNLYNFRNGSDGADPAGLVFSRNSLYGTASAGGGSGNGTVFRLSLGSVISPQARIIPSATGLVLAWPTNAAGFTLQSTTNIASPVWATVTPSPVVVNGQNTVTNPISGTHQFFRLSQ